MFDTLLEYVFEICVTPPVIYRQVEVKALCRPVCFTITEKYRNKERKFNVVRNGLMNLT